MGGVGDTNEGGGFILRYRLMYVGVMGSHATPELAIEAGLVLLSRQISQRELFGCVLMFHLDLVFGNDHMFRFTGALRYSANNIRRPIQPFCVELCVRFPQGCSRPRYTAKTRGRFAGLEIRDLTTKIGICRKIFLRGKPGGATG